MGLLGCKTEEDEKFFESEKGMIETIMKKAEKFRDDSDMIEMYDRDFMLEQIKKKELKDALAKNTQDVTEEVKSDTIRNIAIKLLSNGVDLSTISSATGLSIEELSNL